MRDLWQNGSKSTHSDPQHKMDVNSQSAAPAALAPNKAGNVRMIQNGGASE